MRGKVRPADSALCWDLQDIGQQEPVPAARAPLQAAADAQPDSSGQPQSALPLPTGSPPAAESMNCGVTAERNEEDPAAASLSSGEPDYRDADGMSTEQDQAGLQPHASSLGKVSGDVAADSSRAGGSETGEVTFPASCRCKSQTSNDWALPPN